MVSQSSLALLKHAPATTCMPLRRSKCHYHRVMLPPSHFTTPTSLCYINSRYSTTPRRATSVSRYAISVSRYAIPISRYAITIPCYAISTSRYASSVSRSTTLVSRCIITDSCYATSLFLMPAPFSFAVPYLRNILSCYAST